MRKLVSFLIIIVLLAGCSLQEAPIDEQTEKTPNAANSTSEAPDITLPENIEEREITFGKKGWELPGILTTPKGDDKFPVVILVHGSGPNDRDETIGPNKPFRDIAWGLAQKGIASIRYDKRTNVYGKKMASDPNLTVYEETVEDAVQAELFVQMNSNFICEGTYILGHSLGGYLIPRIAQESEASGYIIVAGPVTPLEDLMVEQVTYIGNLDGSLSKDEERTIKAYEIMRDNIKSLTKDSKLAPFQLVNAPASYWLDLKDYRPAELAKDMESPLLILQGERDYQIPMREFELWQQALEDKKNVTFKSYAGLNHLLMYGTEKSSPEEYNVPGRVDQRVIDDISIWIEENTRK